MSLDQICATHLGHCAICLEHCATHMGHCATPLGHCTTHLGHFTTENRTIICWNKFCWGLEGHYAIHLGHCATHWLEHLGHCETPGTLCNKLRSLRNTSGTLRNTLWAYMEILWCWNVHIRKSNQVINLLPPSNDRNYQNENVDNYERPLTENQKVVCTMLTLIIKDWRCSQWGSQEKWSSQLAHLDKGYAPPPPGLQSAIPQWIQ